MFRALRDNALQQIAVVEALIDAHEALASQQAGDREGLFKEYAVASCATRLYAIYERLVETLISDYLDSIPELIAYSSLPESLRNEYRMGVSHVLGKLGPGRYERLSHEDVIRWYHDALTNVSGYRLISEAFTRHASNLRLPVVEELVSRIDLKNFKAWLGDCQEVRALYDLESAVVAQLEAELKDFVQVRNDAAHGVLETLQGRTILQRYCDVMKALAVALSSFFQAGLLKRRVVAGRAAQIGRVATVFKKSGAFVLVVDNPRDVFEGMRLFVSAPGFCEELAVQSLQLDDVATDRVVAPASGSQIGVKCQIQPRRRALVFCEI